MVQIGVQLQSLQGLPRSVPDTISRIGDTPLQGVELFDPDVSSPSAVADALDEADLEAIGVHVHVGRLANEYEDVVETYETIGCDRLVVPIYDPDAFASIDGIAAAADQLTELSVKLENDGFELLYHNHTYEFGRIGDTRAYDAFVDEIGGALDFELDTGLALYAGAEPTAVLSQYADRIPLVHFTDAVPGQETTIQVELGSGELDVDGCVETAYDADVEWLIYEHSYTDDPKGSLAHAATVLRTLSQGRGTSGC